MRTSISIDDGVAALADKIATREKRNFSNLCEVALAEYCGPRESSQAHAELIATAEEVGIDTALAALKRAMRSKSAKATAAPKEAVRRAA